MAAQSITKKQASARMKKLSEEIEHHRYLYHVRDKQEISDAALDSLKKELADLEATFPALAEPDSPTQRVGGQPLPEFKQVTHATRMLSLQDVFNLDEINQWTTRNQKIVPGEYEYFVQHKIDGVALSLVYQDGKLIQGVTRGDSFVGEDVTQNIRTIEAIPLVIRKPAPGRLEVRGEIYIRKQDFEQMNQARQKKGEPLFANPRNVSAGSIRQLDPTLAASRPLRFMAWEISDGVEKTTRQNEYDMLQQLGFPVPPDAKVFKSTEAIWKHLQREEKKRQDHPFLVDGAVIKINQHEIFERLGIAGKAPRGAIAFKYAAEEATTIVEDIVVQIGRTGAATPVAHLKPVTVAGTTVARASLHNADEIKRKDIRIGDTVIIRKAGDIIPEVIESLPKLRPESTKPFVFPKKCPMCGSPIERDSAGIIARCTNLECFPQRREQLSYVVGKSAFDIDGLGEKIVEQLLQDGIIENAPDLWRLTEKDLESLEGFAEKSASNLIQELKQKKKITLTRFIIALGIPGVGIITAGDLAREFSTLSKFLSATTQQLADIEGIGDKVAASIEEFLNRPSTNQLIKDYQDVGITVSAAPKGGKLSGQTFVFTGNLGDITREEAKQLVLKQGGKVATTPGVKVTHVVVGKDAGSKEKKARELGLSILTPQQFRKRLGK